MIEFPCTVNIPWHLVPISSSGEWEFAPIVLARLSDSPMIGAWWMMAATRPNPYPGPRSFQQGEQLYGRERETAELLDLLIAERIVLLYSPSGAGKTSLVQAALIPELEAEDFRVLPTLRLGYLTADGNAPRVNRYLTSLLLSLERDLPETEQTPLPELTSLSLTEYLDRQPAPPGGAWHGDVLIFDQFEEVLTVDPGGRAIKAEFFEQVGKTLRDRNRWALFSMREEFVAGLDPYLHHIPTRFDKGHRYRLELLGPAAAQEAMQAPARAAGLDFTDAAATKLTDDLREVRIQQPDGATVVAQGDYVEPVQLQVVCRRLWEGSPPTIAASTWPTYKPLAMSIPPCAAITRTALPPWRQRPAFENGSSGNGWMTSSSRRRASGARCCWGQTPAQRTRTAWPTARFGRLWTPTWYALNNAAALPGSSWPTIG